MNATKESIEVLNDLIEINNDRIVGYERALKELKTEDTDLAPLFTEFITQSRRFKNQLGTEVQVLGGEMDHDTTTSGKIYRAWMDVKALFTGNDRHTVLSNCEYGEDAAQKAYDTASKDYELPVHLREIIADQQVLLKKSHDEIKAFRDRDN